MKLQKLGGYAAFASLCIGLAVLVSFSLTQKRFGNLSNPLKAMTAIKASYLPFLLMMIGSIIGLVVYFALHERMQADAPYLTRLMLFAALAATIVGIADAIIAFACIEKIPQTQDVSAYLAWGVIHTGLINTEGCLLGWTLLFAGIAILRTRAFSRILGGLLLLTGIIAIPRFIISQLQQIAHLLEGVSIVWIGIALLWQKQSQPADKEMAAAK